MKRSWVRFSRRIAFGAIALFFVASFNLFAQTPNGTAKNSASVSTLVESPRPAIEPFKIGETLAYEAKYSRLIFRGIDVADLTFKVVDDAPDTPNKIQFKAEAVSKGGLLKMVSYSFLQKFDSTVQTDDFRILQTVRYDEQDERVRNSEANFDYSAKKLMYREVDPKNPMSPPRMISSSLESPVQDLISSFYYVRRQPLAVGQELTVKLSDSGVIYEVPVKITAREQQKSVLGKFWTLRVEPELFGERRPLSGEGKVIIWMTDDARHLPVRAQIHAHFGKIEIKLRRAENLQPTK